MIYPSLYSSGRKMMTASSLFIKGPGLVDRLTYFTSEIISQGITFSSKISTLS